MKSKLPTSLLLFATLLINPLRGNSQSIITIGNGTSSGTSSPIASFYNSSATESIYTGTEIGTTGSITKIGYAKASGASTVNPSVKIYMKTTSLATVGSTSYTLGSANFSSYRLVFDGALPNNSTIGTMEIVLNTPFAFTSTSQNLSVLVVGTTCISSGRPQYKYTTTVAKMAAGYTDGSIGCGGSSSFTENSSFAPVWERPNLVLTLSTLSNGTFENNAVSVIVTNNKLQVSSDKIAIKNVALFDLAGRKLADSAANSNTVEMDLNTSNQLIIAKIITENNAVITKKILL